MDHPTPEPVLIAESIRVVQGIALTFTGIHRESYDRWVLSLSGLPVAPGAAAYRPVHVGVSALIDGDDRG